MNNHNFKGARLVQGVGGNSARYLKQGDEGYINQQFLKNKRGRSDGEGAFRKKILDGGVGLGKKLLLGLGWLVND